MFCLIRNCFQHTQRGLRGPSRNWNLQRIVRSSLVRPFSSGTIASQTVGDARSATCHEVLVHPDAKSVYVHTFGCSHNMSDGETMKGLLAAGGYNVTTHRNEADVWVINTCTVRDKSIQSFQSLYQEAKQKGAVVVIAGCMTTADRDMIKRYSGDSIVGVTEIGSIKAVVDEALKGRSVQLVHTPTVPSLDMPKVRKDPSVEIIPISLGCKGACTFCQTKLARGDLRSYPISDILSCVERACKEGVTEIWLTSEDTGAYGCDIGSSLMVLLKELRHCIEKSNVMVKIGMTNPPYLQSSLPELASFMNHKNFYSYLHIPVQSGSDSVLQKMNRKYSVHDFVTIATYLQQSVPGITLSTDIIVGFPYETENDFADTMKLLKTLNLDIVHYSRYYPRPHTVAAHYPQVPMKTVKSRVKILSDWFKGLNPYASLVSKYLVVWVSGEVEGENRCCHSKSYVKVMIPNDSSLFPGDILIVQCDEAARFHIKAHVVDRLESLQQSIVSPCSLISDRIDPLLSV